VQAINAAVGTELDNTFFYKLGYATLKYETQFNQAAGFTTVDDELPEFFYSEALAPSNKVARFHSVQLSESVKKWWQGNTSG